MTSKEFVVWMQGFVEACNDYSPTPKQWDTIKDKLANVGEPISLPIGTPIGPSVWQHPHYVDPYKITCTTGSATYNPPSNSITATPGYGTLTYNPSTSTQWNASGSLWSYTQALNDYGNWYWASTSAPQQPTTGSNQLELDFEPK